jgi:hypothetical protein
MFLLLTKYYSYDEIKKNENSGACGTHREEEVCLQGLDEET